MHLGTATLADSGSHSISPRLSSIPRQCPERARKGNYMELYQPGVMSLNLQKINDYAKPRFAGGGRETGTGDQSWTEVISGSKVIAGLLTSGYSQHFTRALQRKTAHFWPASCAFSPPFHPSSGPRHLYHVSCLLSSLAHRTLPSVAYVKICQKRRKVILYLIHSKHFPKSCGSTIW